MESVMIVPVGQRMASEPGAAGDGARPCAGGGETGAQAPALDFESAVRGELPVLYRVAKRLVRNVEDAEDLVSQAILNAFKGWRRFDGKHLRSWLIRILRNEFANRRRSEAARLDTLSLEPDIAVTDAPWDALAWRDHAERILAELDSLPIEYRLAVHLCDVEELSYQEAAEAMGVPLGTVRSRLFRGRAMIRTRLTAANVGEGGTE